KHNKIQLGLKRRYCFVKVDYLEKKEVFSQPDVFGLCVRAGFLALTLIRSRKLKLAQMFIRSTSPRLTQNRC
ncbi:hypothetical protein, partial [Chryseobacterium lacus]|uniref:hypothetical protein n=1 Tax=Chryseobacterium lacus TaxID=2058346 RepID=UPI001E5E0267